MTVPNLLQQVAYFRRRQNQILDTIQQLVEIESPSDVKPAVDRVGTVLASRFSELGGQVRVHANEKFGNHLEVRFPAARKEKPVLLLGHMDTVYPIGTISKMPFRVAKGRAWGPGVLDMKSGIALALQVIPLVLELDRRSQRPITIFLVSDEEVGSTSSRHTTEKLARSAAAVLVLEPAHGPRGALKTSRKGVGEYALRIEGKAAHAGLDFAKGQSAVLELVRQIDRISRLTDVERGTTLNVGRIGGGTRVNVVPDEASAYIDVRVATRDDGIQLHEKLLKLTPFNSNCKITVTGGIHRPPMERTEAVASLFAKAKHLAQGMNWDLEEASVGGGSDGNFTAALGVPTLDGLGAVGDGAHSPRESVVIAELSRRASLLAGLLQSL